MDDADAEVAARLRGVIGRLARRLNATSTGEGLTPSQASVLGLVAVRGPLGLAELTDLEGLNPTMLSRIVRKLTEDDLIRRLPDPTDLRAVRVEITPSGALVHERIRALRTRVVSDCLGRLPETTAKELYLAVPALEALAEELRSPPAQERQAAADVPPGDR
jgi:DNA-binding MarR family transcriptional regulator